MKLLGLFRHARPSWQATTMRDFDRELSPEGQQDAAAMGRHMGRLPIRWQRILASPALRARQTIEIAAREAGDCPPIEWVERAYLADRITLKNILRKLDPRLDNVVMCGHNPGLHDLLHDLLRDKSHGFQLKGAPRRFPTAGFAVLELNITQWKEMTSGCGKLIHLAQPPVKED